MYNVTGAIFQMAFLCHEQPELQQLARCPSIRNPDQKYLEVLNEIRPTVQYTRRALVHLLYMTWCDVCRSTQNGQTQFKNRKCAVGHVINSANTAPVLSAIRRRDHISPSLASLHGLSVKSKIEFKTHLLKYKALNDQAPWSLKGFIAAYYPLEHFALRAGWLPSACEHKLLLSC